MQQREIGLIEKTTFREKGNKIINMVFQSLIRSIISNKNKIIVLYVSDNSATDIRKKGNKEETEKDKCEGRI